jgi:hypothetical protein
MKKEKTDWSEVCLDISRFILCFVFIFFSIFGVVKGIRNNATDFQLTLDIFTVVIWFGVAILWGVDKRIKWNLENKEEEI